MIELLLEAERAISFGQLDRAEALYRQVAAADPRNSIAVVGLARVALDREDDLGAYLLARRALIIDPENEAARRLAVRLEEILATRGEPVADPLPRTPMPVIGPPPSPDDPASPAPSPPEPDVPVPASDPAPDAGFVPPRPKRSLLDRLRGR